MNEHWGELATSKKLVFKSKKPLIVPYPECADFEQPESSKKTRKRLIPKNKIVNQTIEVLDQTDVIRDLIDTYKPGGFNYVFNPCQMIPKIEALSEQSEADRDNKFIKPLWFIPPEDTKFTLGRPQEHAIITKKHAQDLMRKSLAGLLRIADFKNATNSALILFVDALDEFYKNILEKVQTELLHAGRDSVYEVDVMTLEKAYVAMNKKSLLTLHNYYKNDMFKKNRIGIEELKSNFQEYEKIIQMNQKPPNIKEEDLASYLDYSDPKAIMGNQNGLGGNLFESGDASSLGDIFEREYTTESGGEDHLNLSVGPSSIENN